MSVTFHIPTRADGLFLGLSLPAAWELQPWYYPAEIHPQTEYEIGLFEAAQELAKQGRIEDALKVALFAGRMTEREQAMPAMHKILRARLGRARARKGAPGPGRKPKRTDTEIQDAYEKYGRISDAAKALKITPKTVVNRLRAIRRAASKK